MKNIYIQQKKCNHQWFSILEGHEWLEYGVREDDIREVVICKICGKEKNIDNQQCSKDIPF